VTDSSDTRADSTRQQILHAAAQQFARRSYSLVSLDDILSEAQVTKGAMYFHFRSKHALAMAIIDEQAQMRRAALDELLARQLSGLETLVDISYLIAAHDIGDVMARAGLHLVESIGRNEGLQAKLLAEWIRALTVVVRRAVDEGDILAERDPEDVSRVLVALYAGIRQISDLDDPPQFLTNLELVWAATLPGFANPDRVEYLTQFVQRRTAVAIANATPQHPITSTADLADG
jgi:AcrR family transcriptional regulator